MIFIFHLKQYLCSNCGKTLLVPGPMGGHTKCPGCSCPHMETDKTFDGPEISAEVVKNWWKGLCLFCEFCGGFNDTGASACKFCGAPLEGGKRPDNKDITPEMRKVLKARGIDIEMAAPEPEWKKRQAVDYYAQANAPVSEPAPIAPPPVPVAHVARETKPELPKGTDWVSLAKIVGIAGIVVAVVALFVWLIIWATTPNSENLTVSKITYTTTSASWTEILRAECEKGANCPSAQMTPVATFTEMVTDEGTEVVATVVATREVVEHFYPTATADVFATDVPCAGPTVDLGGITGQAMCSPTPETLHVTEVSYPTAVTQIVATYTPHPVTKLSYTYIKVNYGGYTLTVDVTKSPIETMSMLKYLGIPADKTPEPSMNDVQFDVYFTNEKGEERHLTFTDKEFATWATFFEGQTFNGAMVLPNGTIKSLTPSQP